jgi:hypothetical protein
MQRRDLLPILGAAALPLQAQHEHHKPAKIFADSYQLRAFSAEQDQALSQLADIIIPDDATSRGAGAARVSRYFDFLAHYTPALKSAFLSGLEAVNTAAQSRFGHAFAHLDRSQQTALVELMAQNESAPTNDLERFFEVLKFHTVEGYRFSHIGQTEWIRYQPHPGGLYPDNTVDRPLDAK